MGKKILVLGATGAMAVYLIPELLKKGYTVDGVSLDDVKSDNENLRYIKANAKDIDFLKELLKENYDGIVDFMLYFSVDEYKPYYELFMPNTKHYVFLSTYRVYAGDTPLHEGAKRLLESELPDDFAYEREYSIYKAQEEDFIRSGKYKNYSIVRPAITYSKRRFQLTTLEAHVLVYRMLRGKTVVLPESAMDKQATMSWAGDVAKMFSAILFNPRAFGETYNVATSEHMPWRDVAKIYEDIGGLKYITVDDETYFYIMYGSEGSVYGKQQLMYDRCFNRIVDNSKILELCGLTQSDLMPLKDGLAREYKNLNPDDIPCNVDVNKRMDEYLEKIGK